jgi:hypothetical protein
MKAGEAISFEKEKSMAGCWAGNALTGRSLAPSGHFDAAESKRWSSTRDQAEYGGKGPRVPLRSPPPSSPPAIDNAGLATGIQLGEGC